MTTLPWYLYFFKLTQPLTVFTVHLLSYYTPRKGERRKTWLKTMPLFFPYGLRNPYRNLKSGNCPETPMKFRNCTFMNSAFKKFIVKTTSDVVLGDEFYIRKYTINWERNIYLLEGVWNFTIRDGRTSSSQFRLSLRKILEKKNQDDISGLR